MWIQEQKKNISGKTDDICGLINSTGPMLIS